MNCKSFIFFCVISTLVLFPINSFALEPEWVNETDFYASFYEPIELPGDTLVIAGSFESRPCLFMYEIGGDTLWTCLPDSTETSIGALAWVEDVPEGFITCGSIVPQGSDKRCIIALIDHSGNIIWRHIFDLAVGEEDAARCITRSSSTGDYFFTGYANPSGDHLQAATGRLSSSGEIIWIDLWGNVNTCRGINIKEIPSGQFAVIMQSGRPSLLVYTQDGNIILNRYYTGISVNPPSGLEVNSTGYCFATKYFCLICKVDLFGVLKWVHGFSGGSASNCFMGIKETGDGGHVAAGYVTDFYPNYERETSDGWIVRINSEGTMLWNHRYANPTRSSVQFMGVLECSSGGYLAIGNTAGKGLQIFYPPTEGIEEQNNPPILTISNISPNPLSSHALIEFSLAEPSEVTLTLYDMNGRVLENVSEGVFPQGTSDVEWVASENLSTGCYLLNLSSGTENATRNLIILR